ncbi:TRAP transporter substrate-binding protein [Arvimicrobium flavum]|uniref:TRAP transporter substrate-binding protein n=1 Tax=Arvimicrobium flavum TaxID=3393320 RepID=UPI00237BBCCB|nr:TRAP transporter substrate-binding protein [Mesorhizobium shangrilense]
MNSSLNRRAFAAAMLGTVALAAGFGVTQADAQSRTLRLSHHLAPGHLVDVASHRFAELVAEQSKGAIKVEVFPSGQIAGLRQGAEAVQFGTVDFVWTDFGTLANWRPEYGFVSLPFLFQGDDHFDAVFNGDVGRELRDDVSKNLNIEALGYGNAGFRVIATSGKAVKEPADLKGVRIRVPEVPILVSAFKSVGANPTPMAWGEVYTALQTGVIDAVENPAEGLAVGGMQEVTKYLSRTYHIMTDVNLFVSNDVMSSFTPELQEAIRASAKTAVDEFNAKTREAAAGYWKQLSEKLETVEEPNRAAFQEAMAPVWKEFTAAAGEAGQGWIDRIQAVPAK